jgi:hypothetical protein
VKKILAIAFGIVLMGLGAGIWTYTANHPAPPAASAPVAVVAADYLKAAKAQNCALTRELTLSGTLTWCNDPRMLGYSAVEAPHLVRATTYNPRQWCVDFTMTITESSDETMSAGTEPWSYCFVRTKVGWRLWDQGQG